MRFAYGATRFVILTENFAIKIPRFRPFRMAAQLYRRYMNGTVESGLGQFSNNKVLAVLMYIATGFLSNIREARMTKLCPKAEVAPTIFSLFGFLNVQIRGEAITDDEITKCPFRDIASMSEIGKEVVDLSAARQVARFGDKILLVDSGGPIFHRIMMRRYKVGASGFFSESST